MERLKIERAKINKKVIFWAICLPPAARGKWCPLRMHWRKYKSNITMSLQMLRADQRRRDSNCTVLKKSGKTFFQQLRASRPSSSRSSVGFSPPDLPLSWRSSWRSSGQVLHRAGEREEEESVEICLERRGRAQKRNAATKSATCCAALVLVKAFIIPGFESAFYSGGWTRPTSNKST